MEKFTTLKSIAVPLPLMNVDTDQIYPGRSPTMHTVSLERKSPSHALNAFGNLRYDADGTPRPDFVLNQPRYAGARILLALDNFGCGSSREMAVWCLYDLGLRCVVAPGFGDIFYANACLNGLLPVRLPRDVVTRMIEDATRAPTPIEVDLLRQVVTAADGTRHPFEIDAYRRACLVEGLDEIARTLKSLPAIESFEKEYLRRRPWLAR
ncbi:MAG: 3-isopropylmalate dehydratase small subunit [Gammaproteobacteria bacterium]